MMRSVEVPEHAGRGTFDALAAAAGFTSWEVRLAASTGRLADIVRVAQQRDATRRQVLADLPPAPPVLSGREAAERLRVRAARPVG